MFKRGAKLDFLDEITKNRFLLILLPEDRYSIHLKDIVRGIEQKHKKVCYVCLSRPYADVKEDISKQKINANKFFFIDVLSSHYGSPAKAEDCIFVKEPIKIIDIKVAMTRAIKDMGCSAVLLDSISGLLLFEQSNSILKFTHELKTGKDNEKVNKLFLVLKEGGILGEDSKNLVRDLEMFADKTIDINHI
ncbi:hypothetical protein A3K72_02430 [Candidatus Woesearchaeota archaeon RBG_13_36_6]|nr:MAG: hypothetical protein A3K72_02430 [Candidatus Woesearchaeota archaeon RBG_13_36_6]